MFQVSFRERPLQMSDEITSSKDGRVCLKLKNPEDRKALLRWLGRRKPKKTGQKKGKAKALDEYITKPDGTKEARYGTAAHARERQEANIRESRARSELKSAVKEAKQAEVKEGKRSVAPSKIPVRKPKLTPGGLPEVSVIDQFAEDLKRANENSERKRKQRSINAAIREQGFTPVGRPTAERKSTPVPRRHLDFLEGVPKPAAPRRNLSETGPGGPQRISRAETVPQRSSSPRIPLPIHGEPRERKGSPTVEEKERKASNARTAGLVETRARAERPHGLDDKLRQEVYDELYRQGDFPHSIHPPGYVPTSRLSSLPGPPEGSGAGSRGLYSSCCCLRCETVAGLRL